MKINLQAHLIHFDLSALNVNMLYVANTRRKFSFGWSIYHLSLPCNNKNNNTFAFEIECRGKELKYKKEKAAEQQQQQMEGIRRKTIVI